MCKVFMMSGVRKENVANAWKFIQTIAKPMSDYNKDGLGYAAMTASGDMFGERWLVNSDAFKNVSSDKKLFNMFTALSGDVTTGESNSFGEIKRDEMVAITMHTRMATSPKGMMNTHPFVDEGVSLIHNGVIRNEEDFNLKLSTCDSESILRAYLEEDVKSDPANIQKAADRLRGYYACGVLTNTDQGPILDVFRSSGARLHAAYVEELGTFVISTDDDDIKKTCKELNFTMGSVFKVLDEKFIRIDAVTGRELSIQSFKEAPAYVQSKQTQSYYQQPSNIQRSQVYPFGKKKNTTISDELMEYYKSGHSTCVRLNEREVQEQISHYHNYGG